MTKADWKYITISKEMAYSLDTIIRREKKKLMIHDKRELVRLVLRQFILNYEKGRFYNAQESIRKGVDEIIKDQEKLIKNKELD